MVHTLTNAMDSRRKSTVQFEAYCFRITRLDGFQLFLTDAQEPLTLADGVEYQPAGGFNTSARRKASDLDDQSFDAAGVLTADIMTHEDLRGGRYLGARIDVFLVDYRVPWAGHFHQTSNWVQSMDFDHGVWKMEIEGFTSQLKQVSGLDAAKTCTNELGDAFGDSEAIGCKADLASLGFIQIGQTVAFASGSEPRRVFDGSNQSPGEQDYVLGRIRWLTGKNAGTVSRVRSAAASSPRTVFELFLETPHDIEALDSYTLEAGCNKLAGLGEGDTTGHCFNKFNQILNFSGEPYLPGTGRVLRSPIV